MSRKTVLAICAAVALVAIGVTIFWPSDEARVRKVLDRFATVVSFKSDSNPLLRAGKLRSETKELVTDDVHVVVADTNVHVATRDQLVEAALASAAYFADAATVSFTGLTVKIDPAATTAIVDGTAVVTGDRGGEHQVDRRPIHFLLRNGDGWRISTIDVAAPAP